MLAGSLCSPAFAIHHTPLTEFHVAHKKRVRCIAVGYVRISRSSFFPMERNFDIYVDILKGTEVFLFQLR